MQKENLTAHKQPLMDSHTNYQYQTPKALHKSSKQEQLLVAVEEEIKNDKECNLMNVILDDPLLKELNASLEK